MCTYNIRCIIRHMVFKIFRCRNTSGIDSKFALTSYIKARMFVAKKNYYIAKKKEKRTRECVSRFSRIKPHGNMFSALVEWAQANSCANDILRKTLKLKKPCTDKKKQMQTRPQQIQTSVRVLIFLLLSGHRFSTL